MIILGYFLVAVAQLLNAVLGFFVFVMIARAILSWFSPDPNNMLVQFLYMSTEPLISRVRRYVPPFGMIDMSVFVVILVLYFLQTFLVGIIAEYARVCLRSAGAAPV